MAARVDVATLVARMNDALASIHSTIEGLSISAAESDTKLDELEKKRDMTLAELKAAYEKEQQELAAARQKELEEIAEQRRREDEEREARRRREDEERAARKAKEDEEKQGTFDTTARNVEDEMDDLMDSIEEETARKMAEGEAKLADLEEKRRELNRLIEEQMKAAVPPVPTRRRARTVRNSGAATATAASAEPSLPQAGAPPAGSAPIDQSVKDEAPRPSDDPQTNAPAREDEGLEGDDSQPQPKEAVAERSVEEEEDISTPEPQRSEVTHPTAAASSEPEEAVVVVDVDDKASPQEAAAEAALSADASRSTREPEAESAKDVVGEPVPEEPASSPAAVAAEDSQLEALAETEDPPVEFQKSVPAEDKGEAEKPEGMPESAPDEAPSAVEERSVQEPAPRESAPVESKIADEAPATGPASAEARTDSAADEDPVGHAPQDEVDDMVREHASAPEPSAEIEERQEDPKALDDAPAEEQPPSRSGNAAAPEPSLAEELDDTPKAKEGQVAGQGVDETKKERPVPEFSIKTVVDEHVSEEDHAAGSAEQAVEEAQPETGHVKEHHEKDPDETRDVSKADAEAVEGEPGQEDDKAVGGASHLDGAASGEETKHEETTVTLAKTSAEPEEPTGALAQESNASSLKETPKESDTAAVQHAQEDIIRDAGIVSRSLALEDAPAQDEAPASHGVAKESEASEHEDARNREDAALQETTRAESAREPESPAPETAPAHDDAHQDDTAAPSIQTPKIVSVNVEDSSEEPGWKERSEEQEGERVVDDSLAEVKASMVEDKEHKESATVDDRARDDKPAGKDSTAAEETSARQVAFDEERSKPTDDEFLSEAQIGSEEKQLADAPATDSSQPRETAQFQDNNQGVDLAHVEVVSGHESPAASGEVQARPASQETPVEVSELPQKTREEEEHLPTAASKDPEDGDSKHGDAAHTPEEQLAGGVPDAVEDDSAVGPSHAAADAPAHVKLTEEAAADGEARALAHEVHDEEGDELEDDQDVREDAPPASPAGEDRDDKVDSSSSLESRVDGDEAHASASGPHEDSPGSRDAPLSVGHAVQETGASDEAEEAEEEKGASAFAAGPDRHETRSPLADDFHDDDDDDLKETAVGHGEAAEPVFAHDETAKVAVDDEDQTKDAEVSEEEEKAYDESRLNDLGQHDSQGAAATATRDVQGSSVQPEPESEQHDSHHAEAEVLDPSRDDASFDDVDRSLEADLSVITEHTEPAASAAGDTSELVAKPEEPLHPVPVSRDVSAAPDATLGSSYMTETTSMAADQSYEQDRQHGSFSPAVGAFEPGDRGLVTPDRAHLDEEEEDDDDDDDDNSSAVQSVDEDDDADDSSFNPFSRANAAGYEQPAYQSSNIPYNPFALPTVLEEEPPLNPFADKMTDDAQEASRNPFARNTTSAAENFLRSASALGHSQPSSPEQSFARPGSAQGRRGSVGSNNPFARSTTPSEQNAAPATATADALEQQGVERYSNNPFVRPVSAHGHYEAEDTDTDDEEALAAAESTYRNLFPVRHSPPIANEGGLAPADQGAEPAYALHGFPSPVAEDDQFPPESSPISARHRATPSLDSIQERYNSELEDNMDSDSEEPESLAASEQLLPASQPRAALPMPSISERSAQDLGDPDEEKDEGFGGPQTGRVDNVLTSPEYRPSPPPPPPLSPNHHNLRSEEVENSSEDEGDVSKTSPAQTVQTSTISSLQYSPAPPSPPPRAFSSQGHYSQEQEQKDSSEGEQNDDDDAFTLVQPGSLSLSQSAAPASGTPPPRAPSPPLTQTQIRVEDSDEEDQVVLPASISQPNIPSAPSLPENQATPSPPSPPRAPSSQGLHNQEHQDSSEDQALHSQDVARPGQFPFSSSSQSRATPPPSPPPRAPSSQGQQTRQDLEVSEDEEDEWDSKAAAALPDQTPGLSTSQQGPAAPPPPPPRAPSAQDRYRRELLDSDGEENEEEREANRYGQTTNLMGAGGLAASSQTAQTSTTEPAPAESVPATSSRELQSHQRREKGEESDDSWEDIEHRGGGGEAHAADSADPASPALPTPQMRAGGYEQQWSNASNDRISTTSTYLQRSGPGDFTDTESQEYATPLPSAELSAAPQYTQGAMDSPRRPGSADLKNAYYDQSHDRGAATSPPPGGDQEEAPSGQRPSLAEELGRGGDSDSDSDGEYYDHTQAPAFLTQGFAPQRQHPSDEPVVEQVVATSRSDEEDGPRTAVISPDEHPTQYASARFGASSWRDELKSPVLFGSTRQSRSGSFREDGRESHGEADAGRLSLLPESAHRPELPAQDPYYAQHQSPVYGQGASDQQPAQLHGQDPYAAQSSEHDPHGHPPVGTQPLDPAEGSWEEEPQARPAQPTPPQPDLGVGVSAGQEGEEKEEEEEEEDDDEQRTPHLAPQKVEQHADVSPLALRREESPAAPSPQGTPSRGLAFSRHNPERPQTPPDQSAAAAAAAAEETDDDDIDPELLIPRDVTNVPWRARADSVPYSVQSQSTIDSVASSPVHSALHVDKHEPVIRDSWPASMHGMTRPRNGSTLTDRDDYDPFKYEGGGGGGGGVKAMRGPSGSVGSVTDTPNRNSVSNSSPVSGGGLISRMRGIFENAQAKQEPASPARSRPVSGVFHPVQRAKAAAGGSGGDDSSSSPGLERGGTGLFPPRSGEGEDEEDEADEQSALLGGRVKRDAEYDELDERPRRKYQRDASGLRVPVAAAADRAAGALGGGGGPEEPSGESVFRLPWLFVEGWRRKLRRAGDTVERSRWEWEIGGGGGGAPAAASGLAFGEALADARRRAPREEREEDGCARHCSVRKRRDRRRAKSVHWAPEPTTVYEIYE
ncbi:hypothetical protein LX36DRAFT_669972 [Colletotrichum falcatum]|nr:hypothetical protein LX36DRAFT_669972 [Colletotrichum falcatum]